MLKKEQFCQNKPKNSYTEKKAQNFRIRVVFQRARLMRQKNMRYFYRGKDCIEKFCRDLKELRTEEQK